MWQRFCVRPVMVDVHQLALSSRRTIVLRHTNVLLSNGGAGRHQQQQGVEEGQLADEANATWDEARLMTTHLQESGGRTSPTPCSERHNGSNDRDWTEPALEDLDRSIPQVDCAFIADLIRARNKRRKEFLEKKAQVKAKVEALSKQQAVSVMESAKFPIIGPAGMGRGGAVAPVHSGEDGDDIAVAVSPEVVAQLSDDERDALLASRPEYDDGFVLLDCRTVNEVTSWGMIEGAKVLPAHEMFDGFHLTPEEFEVEFGFAKPRPEQKIICYCQYGPRALMAAQILSWMGYVNVLHFRDGYYEWGKQYNLLLRRWMLHDKESGNEVKRQVAFQAGLELQREIAPEFNELPMKEAARYKIGTTRSRGKMLVGEGVREAAYKQVAELVTGMEPPLLPGVLDDADRAGSSSRAVGMREEHLQRFLQETTGMDARNEDTRPPMGLAEAQEKVMDAFTRRDGGSHPRQR
ncbi:Rhodanese-like protein [Trypanosoma grayi]|uniref:Rhodanese-like protein n=1 Tax=Trypanosoma grayi TaxID=71804 RepID=UPI0004F3F0D9|nr:Rhodanese-like protein [Trypanosoma grayi]KEG11525.1 Rhodanese-like protein [Trypanosoma grayi]